MDMLLYSLSIGWKSIKRTPAASIIASLAVGIGIAACTVMLTMYASISRDPLSGKSDRTFHVQIDTRTGDARKGAAYDALTYSDATELVKMPGAGGPISISYSSYLSIRSPDDRALKPTRIRAVTSQFFEVFDLQIDEGSYWSRADDDGRARVAVISRNMSQQLFGGKSIDKQILIAGKSFTVVGVRGDWSPISRFYDLSDGVFAPVEEVMIPLESAIDLGAEPVAMVCWAEPGDVANLRSAPCGWLHAWATFQDRSDATRYFQSIRNMLSDVGLDDVDARVRSLTVGEWIDEKQAVPKDIRLQTFLAFVFLSMCTVSVAGILLMKYYERRREMSIRRALGASKRTISAHICSESLILVGAGSLLGVALGAAALKALSSLGGEYAALTELDAGVLAYVALIGFLTALLGSAAVLVKIAKSDATDVMGAGG